MRIKRGSLSPVYYYCSRFTRWNFQEVTHFKGWKTLRFSKQPRFFRNEMMATFQLCAFPEISSCNAERLYPYVTLFSLY
jgi:hypothetical protein